MADINTYTATPCGQTTGPEYEIAEAAAASVPFSNLAAVKVSENPDVFVCCTINRNDLNQTPEENVKPAQDSGYSLSDCEDCNDHW